MSLFNQCLTLHVPDELMSVMRYYEDTCVMECCGIAALNLCPQRVVDGMYDHGLAWAERAMLALEKLIEMVLNHRGSVASDQNGFGERWKTSDEAALFLNKVKDSLSAAIENVKRNGLSKIR